MNTRLLNQIDIEYTFQEKDKLYNLDMIYTNDKNFYITIEEQGLNDVNNYVWIRSINYPIIRFESVNNYEKTACEFEYTEDRAIFDLLNDITTSDGDIIETDVYMMFREYEDRQRSKDSRLLEFTFLLKEDGGKNSLVLKNERDIFY